MSAARELREGLVGAWCGDGIVDSHWAPLGVLQELPPGSIGRVTIKGGR